VINFDDPVFIAKAIGVLALVALLAGIYPAMYLSSFSPIKILRGFKNRLVKGGWIAQIFGCFSIFDFGCANHCHAGNQPPDEVHHGPTHGLRPEPIGANSKKHAPNCGGIFGRCASNCWPQVAWKKWQK
jgi:hypothetical protein